MYIVYSCYKLGIRGDFRDEIASAFGSNQRIAPTYTDVNVIGFENNNGGFRATVVKEIIAYPESHLAIQENYAIPIHDFTKR